MKDIKKLIILNKVEKELNFAERIIAKIFINIIYKVYNIAKINTINEFMKYNYSTK